MDSALLSLTCTGLGGADVGYAKGEHWLGKLKVLLRFLQRNWMLQQPAECMDTRAADEVDGPGAADGTLRCSVLAPIVFKSKSISPPKGTKSGRSKRWWVRRLRSVWPSVWPAARNSQPPS
ncbi:hypothetical protein E2562_029258 [Oryza meyeriana var. granulata]|uniref:Uncharacterized protein n=1 Tax=Oryza meyeriana var. granulata TaxID=110450 RepID=A0A6G1EQY7_9ORYZ|nr:hypothetical protein E2562_029258 [Oryza meyeriana var. granulata]